MGNFEDMCRNDAIIIMQAANTGLTGGSTPYGNNYDRPILIVNTMRVDDIHILNDGGPLGFQVVHYLVLKID